MQMTTRKVVGIVLATNVAMALALLTALWAASSAAATPAPSAQASTGHPSPLQAAPTPVPGGPGYYSISPGDMVPTDYTIEYQAAQGWISTTVESTLRDSTLYAAGLHLPQGARVTRLVVYGYDDDPSQDFWYRAAGETLDGDAVLLQEVTDVTYSDTSVGAFVDYAEANEGEDVIDNSIYQYLVIAHLPVATEDSELKIMGFRVDYSFDTYVPLTMRQY